MTFKPVFATGSGAAGLPAPVAISYALDANTLDPNAVPNVGGLHFGNAAAGLPARQSVALSFQTGDGTTIALAPKLFAVGPFAASQGHLFSWANVNALNTSVDTSLLAGSNFPYDLIYDNINAKLYVSPQPTGLPNAIQRITINRIDPGTLAVDAVVNNQQIGNAEFIGNANSIATDGTSIFVLTNTQNAPSKIIKFSIATGLQTASLSLTGLAKGSKIIYDPGSGNLYAIGSAWMVKTNAALGAFTSIALPWAVPDDDLTVRNGYVWTANEFWVGTSEVAQYARVLLDLSSMDLFNFPLATNYVDGIASDSQYVWMSYGFTNPNPGTLVAIDPVSAQIVQTYPLQANEYDINEIMRVTGGMVCLTTNPGPNSRAILQPIENVWEMTNIAISDIDVITLRSMQTAINTFTSGAGATKGYIRVTSQTNPLNWALFTLQSMTVPTAGWHSLAVTPIASSAPFPFTHGETVTFQFDLAG